MSYSLTTGKGTGPDLWTIFLTNFGKLVPILDFVQNFFLEALVSHRRPLKVVF